MDAKINTVIRSIKWGLAKYLYCTYVHLKAERSPRHQNNMSKWHVSFDLLIQI